MTARYWSSDDHLADIFVYVCIVHRPFVCTLGITHAVEIFIFINAIIVKSLSMHCEHYV